MKTMKKLTSSCIALALCIAMLLTSTVVYATEPNAGDMARDGVVYSSETELYSAMRAIFKEKQTGSYKFDVTEELLQKVCTYDTGYQTYMFDFRRMFDFYGDQTSIAANEGDYLEQQRYWNISTGVNGTTIEIDTSGTKYCNTVAQESSFERKLSSLFASGGALAHVKSLSASEKVVACMDYINANVRSVSSYDALRHTAYSALCEGQATCQGKALLLYRMLREVGITNRILMGTDSAAHTYNIVLIDGKYYYCDPSTTSVVLKGSSSFSPAQLQEHYQTAEFKNNILSRISATDYPVKTTTETPPVDTGNSNAGASNSGNNNTTDNTQNNTTENSSSNFQQQTEPVEYEILDGADTTYNTYQPSDDGLSLRAAGEIEKFVSVEVDGEIVDPKYYTVKEGSTIIIFTKEFMDMLTEGDHVVKFNFTDGFASANITVVAVVEETETEALTEEELEEATEESTELPSEEEKDNGSFGGIWIVVIILVIAAGAAGVVFYLKKKQEGNETVEDVEDTED